MVHRKVENRQFTRCRPSHRSGAPVAPLSEASRGSARRDLGVHGGQARGPEKRVNKLSNSYKVFTDHQAEDCELFESLKPRVGSSIQLQVWIFWSSTGATEDLVRGPVRSSLEEATCSVSGKLLVARCVWSGEGLG